MCNTNPGLSSEKKNNHQPTTHTANIHCPEDAVTNIVMEMRICKSSRAETTVNSLLDYSCLSFTYLGRNQTAPF